MKITFKVGALVLEQEVNTIEERRQAVKDIKAVVKDLDDAGILFPPVMEATYPQNVSKLPQEEAFEPEPIQDITSDVKAQNSVHLASNKQIAFIKKWVKIAVDENTLTAQDADNIIKDFKMKNGWDM